MDRLSELPGKPLTAFRKKDLMNNSVKALNSILELSLNMKPHIWTILEIYKKGLVAFDLIVSNAK